MSYPSRVMKPGFAAASMASMASMASDSVSLEATLSAASPIRLAEGGGAKTKLASALPAVPSGAGQEIYARVIDTDGVTYASEADGSRAAARIVALLEGAERDAHVVREARGGASSSRHHSPVHGIIGGAPLVSLGSSSLQPLAWRSAGAPAAAAPLPPPHYLAHAEAPTPGQLPCMYWLRSGKCPYGDECSFTHAAMGVSSALAPRRAVPAPAAGLTPPPLSAATSTLRVTLSNAAATATAAEVSRLATDVSEAMAGLAAQKARFLGMVSELETALAAAHRERDRAAAEAARDRSAADAAAESAARTQATATSALQALAHTRAAHNPCAGRIEAALAEAAAARDAAAVAETKAHAQADELYHAAVDAEAARGRGALYESLEQALRASLAEAEADARHAKTEAAARVAEAESRARAAAEASARELAEVRADSFELRSTLRGREDALVKSVESEAALRKALGAAGRMAETERADAERRLAEAEATWQVHLSNAERAREAAAAEVASTRSRLATREDSLSSLTATWERTLAELERARAAEAEARSDRDGAVLKAAAAEARADSLAEEGDLLRDALLGLQRDVNSLRAGLAAGMESAEEGTRALKASPPHRATPLQLPAQLSPAYMASLREAAAMREAQSSMPSPLPNLAPPFMSPVPGPTPGPGWGATSRLGVPVDLDASFARFMTPRNTGDASMFARLTGGGEEEESEGGMLLPRSLRPAVRPVSESRPSGGAARVLPSPASSSAISLTFGHPHARYSSFTHGRGGGKEGHRRAPSDGSAVLSSTPPQLDGEGPLEGTPSPGRSPVAPTRPSPGPPVAALAPVVPLPQVAMDLTGAGQRRALPPPRQAETSPLLPAPAAVVPPARAASLAARAPSGPYREVPMSALARPRPQHVALVSPVRYPGSGDRDERVIIDLGASAALGALEASGVEIASAIFSGYNSVWRTLTSEAEGGPATPELTREPEAAEASPADAVKADALRSPTMVLALGGGL
jgi:hypothetical protein